MLPGQCAAGTVFDKTKLFCVYKNNLSPKSLSLLNDIVKREKIVDYISEYGGQLFGNEENVNENNEMCPDSKS